MEELINQLNNIRTLSDLENWDQINPNVLLCAIAKSKRYDLLTGHTIRLDLQDTSYREVLIDLFITKEVYYDMRQSGFTLTKEE